ncbi:Nucleoside transporter domain containing protein [Tylopilus felleus]
MIDSTARYRAIPSLEDQVYHSGDHEDSRDGSPTTSEPIPAAAGAKWTYFLLGCAILLPFNALFNSTSFFLSRLAGSSFYTTYSSYSSSAYTCTKLVWQFYCTVTSKQSSASRRISGSLTGMIFVVTLLCLSTFIPTTPSTFFVFALVAAAALGLAASYHCTAVYAGAALFGAPFLRAVLSGQAAIAVVVSAVQVASAIIALWGSSPMSVLVNTMGAGGRDDQAEALAARIFFGVSAVFLCITLGSFTWLTRQPLYKSVTSALEQHRRAGVADERSGLLADNSRSPSSAPNSDIYRVFRQNLVFMFSIAYVFVVTLAIYPVVTARVRPVNPHFHPMLFTAVHFLVMNTGGFIGQYSCSFPCLRVWSGKKILAMSLLRTVFIPLVLFCNVERRVTSPVPSIIHSDILFMLIMLIMGYSTGYVAALTVLAVSSLEHNPRLEGRREDVDVAAALYGSCMILGLALGSLSSFGVLALI